MKLTPRIFGLWLIAASMLVGAPTKDVQITAPAKKEAPSSLDRKQGSAPDWPVVDSGRRGRLEDTVQIVSVTEQKPAANGSRKVTVRVHYVLVHYPKGVLSLGFTLKSPTQFAQVGSQPVLSGEDEVDLSATIVPVAWPKAQPFKLSVSLSAEPHPGSWSMLVAVAQPMKPAAAPAPAK